MGAPPTPLAPVASPSLGKRKARPSSSAAAVGVGDEGHETDPIAEGNLDWHDEHLKNKLAMPSHCNPVLTNDGYRRSAMLFVDETFMDCHPSRDCQVGALVWRPFVRFDSSTLRFDFGGSEPRLVQVNVGMDDAFHLNERPLQQAAPMAAAGSM